MMTGLECLALAIYFEARSEPVAGQIAVAEVVYNRVIDHRFPDTVCDVVWQRKQFSWTHDGKSDKPKDKQTYKEIYVLAKAIQNGILFEGHGATHYHADYVAPYWRKDLTLIKKVGKHMFYRWEQ
jgi:spore germination cell wall hydrolase CwlJ-like protein